MAMQAENHVAFDISAEVIGNAFVEEYYHLLHQSPELLYGFYIRPTKRKQRHHRDDVAYLTLGCLTGKDNVRRKFTQTFFLAPQVTGYFVLNDDFRYVVESESLEDNSMSISGIIYNTPVVPLPSDPEPIPDPDHPAMELAATFDAEDLKESAEVCDRSDSDEGSVLEEEVTDEPPTDSNQNEINTVVGSVPSSSQEEKKLYASIMSNFRQMKVTEVVRASTPVYAPTNSVRLAAAVNPYQQSAKPSPELLASSPRGDNAPESTDVREEGKEDYHSRLGMAEKIRPNADRGGVDSKMTASGVVGTLVAAGDEFRKLGEFSGRPTGPNGHNCEDYQCVDNGSGRIRPGGTDNSFTSG
ncbi:nuclear transport factor 2 (NTF2) family protein with RNA binding (RRM-RBD-RNP motifs) domain-containing protein [Actinidia rufa]|uniref:Nuclear transport factor 2 (NTF2) family protein with RNA binding (RRM-RBD-RNP motifs) domain-containing protein n=1 Tax=Actinidia rufa TaxID=165716 RepID=A0A7J0DQJ3_9ERIC|nr:nuclear transport factor 2 (NTF2) family protein with RNA binding (RRM-RBD-RNP motifs) domain-containing protein [Actinidia rufa]